MSTIKAYAAKLAGAPLEPFEFTPKPLGDEEVDVAVDFCARHNIAPVVEEFPMSKVNDALAHLDSGKARYRVVLKNDF